MDIDAIYEEILGTFRVDHHTMVMFRNELARERMRNITRITNEYDRFKKMHNRVNDEISDLIIMIEDISNTNRREYLTTLIQWQTAFDNVWDEINDNYIHILKKYQEKYHARHMTERKGHYKNKNKNNNKNNKNKSRKRINKLLPKLEGVNAFSSYF
jgi:hypothetical protein